MLNRQNYEQIVTFIHFATLWFSSFDIRYIEVYNFEFVDFDIGFILNGRKVFK